ncbi:MAG: 6,7-dimethyl-8-ribityllumazine synthase [Bdellovibrionales bacterium]|nr:6,7-dimethyl-8-ribityllumazine synthase [Bdellovibrionales bacterium]
MEIINSQNISVHCRLAFVVSRFNEEITRKLLEGGLAQAAEKGFSNSDITVVWAPGAVEIPLIAQRLAQRGSYGAIICLGAVIQGETTHYDYVCDIVSQGCAQVSLTFGIPVIFGILTTENEEQALDRCGGKHGHKGKDAVDAAIEMVATLRRLI